MKHASSEVQAYFRTLSLLMQKATLSGAQCMGLATILVGCRCGCFPDVALLEKLATCASQIDATALCEAWISEHAPKPKPIRLGVELGTKTPPSGGQGAVGAI